MEHEEDVSPVNAEVITIRTEVLDDDDDDEETPPVGTDIGCTSVVLASNVLLQKKAESGYLNSKELRCFR